MTWERVLGVLKERGMTNCIRIKEEVDKEALRTLGPNTLADVGCKLVQEDGFSTSSTKQSWKETGHRGTT